MKFFLVALIPVSLFQFAIAGIPATTGLPGITGMANPETDPLTVSCSSPALTSISLTNPAIEVLNETLDAQVCQVATLGSEPSTSEPGAPAVPWITRIYRIPELGGVSLVVRNADYEVIENYNALPCPIEEAGSQRYERDPAFYLRNSWYPGSVAELSEPMIFRDFRVVTVTINPVQVNPVTHQARVYRNIEVEIVANDQPGMNELLHPHQPSGAFASLYRGFIRNLEEDALDDVTTTPGTYLILARDNDSANPWTDSLAEWRTRCGFDVVVERYATQPTATTMLATIQNYYDNATSPLEHVCIIGDPQAAAFGMSTGSSGLMDHYFSRLAGNDVIEDVSIGRLPVASQSDMATVWRKLTAYERDPLIDSTNWFSKSLLYANVGVGQPTNLLAVQWADRQLKQFTGFQNNSILSASGVANPLQIEGQFSSGIGFFLYAGYWLGSLPDIASSCMSGLRQPICILMAGATGQFDAGTCLSESYVLAGTPTSPKGGVAAIGYIGADENGLFFRTFGAGFVRGLCPLQIDRVGLCQMAAFMALHETYGANNSVYTNRLPHVNLIGDPALRMWTDIPQVLSVTHPVPLAVGTREIQVTVLDSLTGTAVVGALVVAWKPNDTITRVVTDSSGVAVLPVTIDSIGTLKLTVTKRNCKPYLADIPCFFDDLMVSLDSMTIDDNNLGGTSGNNDHEFNPGEVIDLLTVLKNYGNATIGSEISAVMSSLSPDLTVVNDISTFPDLPPEAEAIGNSAFRVQVSPDMQNGTEAVLRLSITASGEATASAIPIRCRAGAVFYDSHEFVNSPLEPGTTRDLRVTIGNEGELALDDLSGSLFSQNALVSVFDNSGSFGDIGVGESATNAVDVFTLSATPAAFRGLQVPMTLILESSTGFHDTVTFTVTCGNATPADPTGPDDFGYYAYDDIDTNYLGHPEFEYLDISTGLGGNLNLNDAGEKPGPTPIWSSIRALPFEFTYYNETFDTITICSNGWIAFGNESWSDEPCDRPIPAVLAPSNMVAVYWDDLKTSSAGDGVWAYYDTTRAAYVIQWKARGGGSSYNQASIDFELLILDPAVYPSIGINGKLVFLYNQVTMNLDPVDSEDLGGCSIGIQNRGGTSGLQIVHQDQYSPGAAEIVDGRVILIATDIRPVVGSIEGFITDAESGAALENAIVSLEGYQVESGVQGFYRIEGVRAGIYTVHAQRVGYNDSEVSNVVVELDSTETVNISMLHPELEVSPESISDSLVDAPTLQTSFVITNHGNGPLAFDTEVLFAGEDGPVEQWGSIENIEVSDVTGDLQILGCEYALGHWFVSGAGGVNNGNFIYAFDSTGQYLGWTQQPTLGPVGWYDLAWDGQFLYGSEQGTHRIQGIDLLGNLRTTIPCQFLNPVRAIAYDPATDHFWVADLIRDIFEIDRDGNMVSTIENTGGLLISGLAWYPAEPDGYSLFAFCQDNDANETAVWRFDPLSGNHEFVTHLTGELSDHAAGCTITSDWNSMVLVFGAILQNPNGDRLGVYEADFNRTWIELNPETSTVGAGASQEVTVNIDGTNLRPDIYQVSIMVNSPVLDLAVQLPVALTVLFDGTPASQAPVIPERYALLQNFPNPFNPSTSIPYDLKSPGHVELSLYNIVGQQVTTFVNKYQEAGRHVIQFNASELPSGIYFVRLHSGSFSQTSKMILLK